MASRLNPYIGFEGNARQAMEFYKGVFGGDLTVSTFGEFGAENSPDADKIMHSQLETDRGFTLMASDTPSGMARTSGDNITISLSGEDGGELRGYWDKLVGRRQRDDAPGEADVGRRVRHGDRPVRDPVDGQHHPAPRLTPRDQPA